VMQFGNLATRGDFGKTRRRRQNLGGELAYAVIDLFRSDLASERRPCDDQELQMSKARKARPGSYG
jgi:hypothetical protein